MTNKEILNYLELINDELTDAYHLTDLRDSMASVDALSAIDTAQDLILELQNNLEGKFDDTAGDPDDSWDDEEGRAKPMGPDRLPLNFPFGGDGEGRLKGDN